MSGFTLFVVSLLVLAVVLILSGVKRIPQGMEHTIEHFGKYTTNLSPGLNLIAMLQAALAHRSLAS